MKFLFLLLTFISSAHAFNQVERFMDRARLVVRLDQGHGLHKGDRVLVLAQEDQKLVAIGIMASFSEEEGQNFGMMDVQELMGAHQVVPGDAVVKISPELLSKHHVPGYFSLVLADDHHVPAKYKDLAYMGVFNADGHAIAHHEWLVALNTAQYGLSADTTVETQTSLFLDGVANLGFKHRLMRNRFGHLTFNAMGGRQVNRADWVSSMGMIMTFPSNSKFQSHLIVNVLVEDFEEDNPEVKKYNLIPQSDIRTIYEYVTDRWNRLLFGPLFNFETKTVGGTLGHMWIWDTFHLNLGVGTKDVTETHFRSGGYYGQFDFFWRF